MEMTAIVATVIFCVSGAVSAGGECDDGSYPKKWDFRILTAETQGDGCEISIAPCMPTLKGSIDAIIKITEGDRVLFKIKPDGTSENSPDFNPDLAALMFWRATASMFPEINKFGK